MLHHIVRNITKPLNIQQSLSQTEMPTTPDATKKISRAPFCGARLTF